MRARPVGPKVIAGLAFVLLGGLAAPASLGAGGQVATKQHVVCTDSHEAAGLEKQIIYVDDALRAASACTGSSPRTASRASAALLSSAAAPNELARALLSAERGRIPNVELAPDLARALSVGAPPKAIVVDSRSARLWMLENGRIVDTMKVVVGKPSMATPEMAGRIKYAAVNPYWNVPPDLVRSSIGPKAMSLGTPFLRQQRFELVDRYGIGARPVDPSTVNWTAVMNGTQKVGVRQLPGGSNMMGVVKFIFPNNLGIYLHDTPHRAAFELTDRRLSSGCVRVERASDLYRWLFRHELPAADSSSEQRVILPEPVPVYLFRFTSGGSARVASAPETNVGARSRSAQQQ